MAHEPSGAGANRPSGLSRPAAHLPVPSACPSRRSGRAGDRRRQAADSSRRIVRGAACDREGAPAISLESTGSAEMSILSARISMREVEYSLTLSPPRVRSQRSLFYRSSRKPDRRLCTVCLIEGPLWCGRADRPVLCRYKIIAPTERDGGGCGFLAVERGCGFDDYLPRCARLLAWPGRSLTRARPRLRGGSRVIPQLMWRRVSVPTQRRAVRWRR
jgi:hypothetical protein